jgi:hypothetical protein
MGMNKADIRQITGCDSTTGRKSATAQLSCVDLDQPATLDAKRLSGFSYKVARALR